MAKGDFRTDGYRMSKDIIGRGVFSDALVFKEKGGLTVIGAMDGKVYHRNSYGKHFNKFKSQSEVESFIDDFTKYCIDNKK